MNLLPEIARRVFHLLTGRRRTAELAEELRLHIDLRTQRNVEKGMALDAARREALRTFGSVSGVRDDAREVWVAVWIDHLLQDLKFGARWLRRSPAFTAVVILTLAIGIGVNTAMFSVVNSVLLQPLPYPLAERLIWIAGQSPMCTPDCFNSRADYVIWAREAPSFESMAGFGNLDLALVHEGKSTAERIGFVTDTFWSLTGAHARVGRLPRHHESDSLVLSGALFERQFGGNPNIVGRKVKIEGHVFEITGVLGPEFRFHFPQELYTGDELRDIDAYVPVPKGAETPGDAMRPHPSLGPGPAWLRVFGRLRPGATLQQARAELTVINDRLNQQYPSPYRKERLSVVPLSERVVGQARLALVLLLGAVGFVLVIACANVANLLLARASVRRKEIAIRAALGAGQGRIIRQFATESLLLAGLGGLAGLAIAKLALWAVVHWGGHAVPRLAETTIDSRVLAFTALVSLLTGIIFGLAPASMPWRRNLDEALREDAKAVSSSSRQQRLRVLLVSLEIGLAVVLLSGAGLLLRSFWRMNTFPPGFTPDKVLVMKLSLSGGKYSRNWPVQDAYIRELLQRIETLSGVEAVGIDCGAINHPVTVDSGRSGPTDDRQVVALRAVSAGYFRALGVSLTRGRWPAGDRFDQTLINQSMAWKVGGPNQDFVGKLISGGFVRGTIEGVVADFKDRQLDSHPVPQVFIPYQKSPTIGAVRVIIRTSGDPRPLLSSIRPLVAEIDPNVPIQRFQTLEADLFDSIAPRRFNMYLLASFAAVALMLSLVGIYGVISYIVAQRTREIGIRMALGARRQDIVGMIAGHGVRMTLVGLASGLVAALVLTRAMASLIYDLSTWDPVTFSSVALTIALAALLACCRPAYRASVVDPVIAMRNE